MLPLKTIGDLAFAISSTVILALNPDAIHGCLGPAYIIIICHCVNSWLAVVCSGASDKDDDIGIVDVCTGLFTLAYSITTIVYWAKLIDEGECHREFPDVWNYFFMLFVFSCVAIALIPFVLFLIKW
jgi:hypothetical protein